MIIIEMDSDSQAFHALHCAMLNCGYKIRIALDEGEFKIKADEGTWTAELAGATILVRPAPDGPSAEQLLRDIGVPPSAESKVEWNFDGVTVRIGTYKDWFVTESKKDGFVQVGNVRDGHEGETFHDLESALKAIDAEVASDA